MLVLFAWVLYAIKDFFKKSIEATMASEKKITEAVVTAIEKTIQIGRSDVDVAKELLGTRKFTTVNFRAPICVPYFIELLKNFLGSVELVRIYSTDYEDRHIYTCIEDGVEHAIILNTSSLKGEYFSSEKFDTREFEKEGLITTAGSIRLLIPHKECEEECQVKLMQSIKEAAALAHLDDVEPKRSENTLQIHELYEFGGRLNFQSVNFSYQSMEATLASLSFNPVNLKLGDESYNVPIGKAKEYFMDELKDGRNVLLIGETGTGKTSLVSNILSEMSTDPEVAIIKLDYPSIQLITAPAGKTTIANFIQRQKDQGVKTIIFYVDEGQSIADSKQLTSLLELMDGMKSIDIKRATIAALNSKFEDLDPALKRPGRAHNIIKLAALKAPAIKALAAWIEKNSTLVINHEKIENLEKRGHATLAEVWGTFSPQATVQKWKERFFKYREAQTTTLRKVA